MRCCGSQNGSLKQYYEIWQKMKMFTFHFFHHKIMKWPWLSTYFKTHGVFTDQLFEKSWIQYFLYNPTVLLCMVYHRIPAKEKCKLQIFLKLHLLYSFMFSRYSQSILSVLVINVNDRKFVWQNLHRGHALIRKSLNIALIVIYDKKIMFMYIILENNRPVCYWSYWPKSSFSEFSKKDNARLFKTMNLFVVILIKTN